MSTRPIALALAAFLFTAGSAASQEVEPVGGTNSGFPSISRLNTEPPTINTFVGGLGMTFIDGEPYYLLNLSPEFALGPLGVGLDANLRLSTRDNKLYQPDWDQPSDVLNAIRYVRYGQKRDSRALYLRLGRLDEARLGYGQILYLYNNSPAYDNRKRGVEFDLDLGAVGFESVYSNLARPEIVGLRGYVRPLHGRPLPLLNRIEIGATAAADFGTRAGYTAPDGQPFDLGVLPENRIYFATPGAGQGQTPALFGADIGLPILRNPLTDLTVYLDGATIRGGGSGAAAGAQLQLRGLGLVHLGARLEHRILGDGYRPSYFDAFYELDRVQEIARPKDSDSSQVVTIQTRYSQTLAATSTGNGVYGELRGDVVQKLSVIGSYQRLYRDPKSGWLHVGADLNEVVPKIVLRGTYDKWRIANERDLFTLDDRSIARGELGYKPIPYLTLSILAEWTFMPIRDLNDRIVGYTPQKRIEPKFAFGFAF